MESAGSDLANGSPPEEGTLSDGVAAAFRGAAGSTPRFPELPPPPAGPPHRPSAADSVLRGIGKLIAGAIVFAACVFIGAAAGLTVSGWDCDGSGGGMSFSGCGSDRATLGWIVFGEFVSVGIASAVAILLPSKVHRAIFTGEGAGLRIALIVLAVFGLPVLFLAGNV